MIAVSEFVKRQTKDSQFSHFDGTWFELQQRVMRNFEAGCVRPGYRDGVVLVNIETGVPEHPGCIYTNIVQLKAGDKLAGEFVARQPGEDPRKSTYVINGEKMPAESAFAVLYRHDVLLENNEQSCDADWEIISLNASPFPADVEVPMSAGTLIANYYKLSGGTDTKMTPEQFVDALKKSVDFWKDKANAAPQQVGETK